MRQKGRKMYICDICTNRFRPGVSGQEKGRLILSLANAESIESRNIVNCRREKKALSPKSGERLRYYRFDHGHFLGRKGRNKPRLTLAEVCQALGISTATAYNMRSAGKFPVPMAGNPLSADIGNVAEALDRLREQARAHQGARSIDHY